ncbi:MAG: flagellar hook-basal body complex protein FliE [Planctomycetaceae bacterium]|jgi:flagellar hook-basal body complex protein FliE
MSGPIPITPGVGSTLNSAALPVDASKAAGELPFADLVTNLMQETSNQQAAVGDTVRKLVSGESDSIHDVVLTASKADLAFRLVMEIRNRLITSYEEIMRMQV